jgi:hypothetical protein
MTTLVSRSTQKVIADFSQDSPPEKQIKVAALAQTLAFQGIPIPEKLQEQYQKRSVVYLGDNLFQQAFKEIYAPQRFPTNSYYWIDKTCIQLNSSLDPRMPTGAF